MLKEPRVVKVSEVPAERAPNSTGTWMRVLFPPSEMPTYVMRVFELEPGAHIFAHKHPWEHEIYMLEGRVRIRVEDKYFELTKDMAIYIPPNMEHEYWNIGEGRARFICTIPVKPTATED